VYVSVGDATVTEGHSGTTNATFTVSLSGPSTVPVRVSYQTSDGTATTASGDYSGDAGFVDFPVGTTTQAVTILVNGDTAIEPDETFHVTLFNPVNATVGTAATGMAWLQVIPGGSTPGVRQSAASAYDAPADRMLMYGGWGGYSGGSRLVYHDLWILQGAGSAASTPSWRPVAIPGNGPQGEGGEAAYNRGSNRLIVFGTEYPGQNMIDDPAVLLHADGTGGVPVWQSLPSFRRASATVAYDEASNRLVVFGGFTFPSLTWNNDVHILVDADGAGSPEWIQLNPIGTPPAPRGEIHGFYDASSNRLVIYRGSAPAGTSEDLWVLTNANGLGGTPEWIQLMSSSPLSNRYAGQLAYDPHTKRAVYYAGLAADTSAPLSDTWVLNNADGTTGMPFWTQVTPSGSPISGRQRSEVFMSTSGRTVMAMGQAGATNILLNDVWALDGPAVDGDGLGTIVNDDFAPPVHADAGPDQVVEATSPTGADVRLDGRASVSAASYTWTGDFPTTHGATPQVHLSLGDHVATLIAADGDGRTDSDTVRLQVVDTTAPLLQLAGDLSAEATSSAGATVTFLVSTSDEVTPSPLVVCSPASGSTFPLGTTRVLCSATDEAGNAARSGFNVTVTDTTAPLLQLPGDRTVEATSPAGATVVFAGTASDAGTPSPSVACTPASGSTFPLGTTRVLCSAVDAAGNEGRGGFNVTVVDTTRPILNLPTQVTATLTALAGTPVSYVVSATDIVDPAPTITCSPASGSLFAPGTTTVDCAATDASGNVARGSFVVRVTYVFDGFLPPIANDGSSIFKLGRTIPVKFRLLGDGAAVCGPTATIQVFRILSQATGTQEIETAASGSSNLDNLFRCDSGMYIYNLNTQGYATGTYLIRADLGDGVLHEVRVSIR
jgi:hypothetical protein